MLDIREFRDDDLDGIMAVWEPSFRSAHPFLTDEFVASVRSAIPEVFIPNSKTWVAERDQRIVGFMSLLGQEVGGLFVDPNEFRTGVGQTLLRQACQLHSALTVEVFTKNDHAVRFYRKFGFQDDSRRTHEESGFELTRMSLAVTDTQR